MPQAGYVGHLFVKVDGLTEQLTMKEWSEIIARGKEISMVDVVSTICASVQPSSAAADCYVTSVSATVH
jgi:hypothetical protein